MFSQKSSRRTVLILREHKSLESVVDKQQLPLWKLLKDYAFMQFVHLILYRKGEWGAWDIDFGSTA